MEDAMKKGNGGGGFVHFFFVLSVVLCVLLYAPPVLVPYYRTTTTDLIAAIVADPAAEGGTTTRPPAGGVPGDDGMIKNNRNARGDDDDPPVVPPVVVHHPNLDNQVGSPCSSIRRNSICCDRSDFNTDVCFMAGEVRTDKLSLLLFDDDPNNSNVTEAAAAAAEKKKEEERIRPYTRKWERFIMEKVQELRLVKANQEQKQKKRKCDVVHSAPLLVMTAGGYTGNFFHAFSDGFLPAWVTSQHLNGDVVLGVLSYNPWWAGEFRDIISALSAHPVVDLLRDTRTHCFPAGAIVGTRFHGILTVDPARLRDNKTIVDFHRFLANKAFQQQQTKPEQQPPISNKQQQRSRPVRLGIVSRKGTRVIENQAEVAELARSVGFDEVDILETANGLPLETVYAQVSACDALVGVHGADLTRFLFLRPGHASLTQISPLGISPIARDCFGNPAKRMGLHYEQYEVRGHESSLARRYPLDDVVIADPEAAKRQRGWNFVASVYLGGQNVTLDLGRFRATLQRMHARALQQR